MAEYEAVLFTILCGSIINSYLLLVEKVIAIVCMHMQHVHCLITVLQCTTVCFLPCRFCVHHWCLIHAAAAPFTVFIGAFSNG